MRSSRQLYFFGRSFNERVACTQFQNLEFEIFRKILKKIRVLTSDSVKIEELVESLQAMEMNMRQTTKKRREEKDYCLKLKVSEGSFYFLRV